MRQPDMMFIIVILLNVDVTLEIKWAFCVLMSDVKIFT